jgi:hypothetical protein
MIFNFFVVDDGIISFSLRDLTIVSTIVISTAFMAMLYTACSNELLECSIFGEMIVIPTISDVIALPIFDRIFILLNTIYFMGVVQVSVRAYYKLLNDAGIKQE